MPYLSEPQPFEIWHIFYLLSLFLSICMGIAALYAKKIRTGLMPLAHAPLWIRGIVIILTFIGILYGMYIPLSFPISLVVHRLLYDSAPFGAFIVALTFHIILWVGMISEIFPVSKTLLRLRTKN